MKFVATLLTVVFMAGSAMAGNLTVTVKGADGKPVPDAVVIRRRYRRQSGSD